MQNRIKFVRNVIKQKISPLGFLWCVADEQKGMEIQLYYSNEPPIPILENDSLDQMKTHHTLPKTMCRIFKSLSQPFGDCFCKVEIIGNQKRHVLGNSWTRRVLDEMICENEEDLVKAIQYWLTEEKLGLHFPFRARCTGKSVVKTHLFLLGIVFDLFVFSLHTPGASFAKSSN